MHWPNARRAISNAKILRDPLQSSAMYCSASISPFSLAKKASVFLLTTLLISTVITPAIAEQSSDPPQATVDYRLPPVAPPWEGIEPWLNMRDSVTYPPRVQETCTGCHGIPDPRMLSRESWRAALKLMQLINEKRLGILYTNEQWSDIRRYYLENSLPAQAMPLLPPVQSQPPARPHRPVESWRG